MWDNSVFGGGTKGIQKKGPEGKKGVKNQKKLEEERDSTAGRKRERGERQGKALKPLFRKR